MNDTNASPKKSGSLSSVTEKFQSKDNDPLAKELLTKNEEVNNNEIEKHDFQEKQRCAACLKVKLFIGYFMKVKYKSIPHELVFTFNSSARVLISEIS